MPTSITTIQNTDLISASNEIINDNFTSVNSNKIETSTLDTDGTLAANSDAKIATQKAVKTYVDTSVNLKQTLTQTSQAAPTVNTDTYGLYILTGQVVDVTSMTSNLSGSPVDGDNYDIRITNGISAMTFVASSAYGDASSDTAVVDKPAGTSDGDIMFMVIESGTAYQNALPDGWTSIAQQTSTDFYELAYKVASSEGANYTVTFAAAQPVKLTVVTYSGGFNQSDPIDVFSSTAYVTSDTNNIAASMNVTYENSPLLFFGAVQQTSAITQTKPSVPNTSWVEDYDSGDTNSDFWLEVCSMTWASKGDTGTITSTLSGSETNKHAFAVALKPAIEVTWGASYLTSDLLPTVLLYGETKDISLQYNSALTKWVATANVGNTTDSAAALIAKDQKYALGVQPSDYVKTFFNFKLPFILWIGAVVNDATTTFANWSRTDATKVVIKPGLLQAVFASTADASLTLSDFWLPNGSGAPDYNGGTGLIILDFWAKYLSGAGENQMGFFSSPSNVFGDNATGVGFQFVNGVIYTISTKSDPLGAESRTDVSTGITETNWNNYRIELDLSVSAKLYINGVLVKTYTAADAAFPTGAGAGNVIIGFGRDTTNPVLFSILSPSLSIEMNP